MEALCAEIKNTDRPSPSRHTSSSGGSSSSGTLSHLKFSDQVLNLMTQEPRDPVS